MNIVYQFTQSDCTRVYSQMRCDEFVRAFEQQNVGVEWTEVQTRINDMVAESIQMVAQVSL